MAEIFLKKIEGSTLFKVLKFYISIVSIVAVVNLLVYAIDGKVCCSFSNLLIFIGCCWYDIKYELIEQRKIKNDKIDE